MILITDGEIYDVAGVVHLAAQSHHRLFAIAIGAAPNEALARSLADQTGGACEFVGPNEDAEAAILRTFKRLRSNPRRLGPVQWPLNARLDRTQPQRGLSRRHAAPARRIHRRTEGLRRDHGQRREQGRAPPFT